MRPLQRLLETIYDAPSGHDVRDFLVTERQHLPYERRAHAAEEELVIVEREPDSSLMLYLDSNLLARLRERDPLRSLDGGNIADFWVALEGVSHFSCLMWNAGHDRPVSLLDLELQAEARQIHLLVLALAQAEPGSSPARTAPPALRAHEGRSRSHPRAPAALRKGNLLRGASVPCPAGIVIVEPVGPEAGGGGSAAAVLPPQQSGQAQVHRSALIHPPALTGASQWGCLASSWRISWIR